MKKFISLVLIVMVILTGCISKSVSGSNMLNAYAATNKSIPFKYAFTGFVPVKDVYKDLPSGVKVFKTEKDWTKFKDKYLAGVNIPYPGYAGGFNFSKNYVIYYSTLDAKADFYAKAWQIGKVSIVNKQVKIALKEISSSLTITASNSEKFGGHRYVIILTVNKNYLKSVK